MVSAIASGLHERPDQMSDAEHSQMEIQAEVRTPSVTIQIVRFVLADRIDSIMHATDGYRLNMCLTPRPLGARSCYEANWGPHRFEPVGDIFMIPPGHALHTRSGGGRQVSIICDLARDAVECWLDEEIEWTDRRLEASLDVPSPHIRSLLGRMAEEAHRPGIATNAMAELIAGQLAIELGRFCASIVDGPASGGLAAWRLRLIDERLRNLAAPATLGELAELCNLSVRQLTRGFRTSRGCSINDHVARIRIEGAKRLLASDESIKGIAFAVGFSSPSSFAQAFRHANGITPRQFRQRMRRDTR